MARKRGFVVVAALVAVAVFVAYEWRVRAPGTEAVSGAAPNASTPGTRAAAPSSVPAVRLDALADARAETRPSSPDRDPFRFKPKPTPPPPPPPRPQFGPGSESGLPPPPPPLPPIPFKFIGIVRTPSQKLAVLTDTRDVFYGREGDVIDGRYRILRIGVESIEMAYLDGRGRQVIRLSGS
jgi:hypothetical protein